MEVGARNNFAGVFIAFFNVSPQHEAGEGIKLEVH